MQAFARTDPLPSWFANALGKFLSTLAPQFQLVQVDATHVKVPAAANDGASILSIEGLWRFVEADVGPIAHPGGAAGQYPIFVTTANNNITNVPDPFTDHTVYTFGLQILAPATTPAIVAGVVDKFRQVGYAVWDGAKITRVEQTVPPTEPHLQTGIPPIGSCIAYTGAGEPPEGEWAIADGKLVDKTTYAQFFDRTQHKYNGGVDPGSNKVRLPDKRGKSSVGAINMGSALGAGANDNAHVQAVQGASSGEVTHTTTVPELPAHAHPFTDNGHVHSVQMSTQVSLGSTTAPPPHTHDGVNDTPLASGALNAFLSFAVNNTGGGGAHNTTHPVEADVWIVRIA